MSYTSIQPYVFMAWHLINHRSKVICPSPLVLGHLHFKVNGKGLISVYFIQPTRCNLYNVLYYYQCITCFGRYFCPSSGAYKTVCAVYTLQQHKLNSSNPTTLAADSGKAWQYPRLHIQFYKLLMMGGNTSRNMYSADNNKEYCISCILLVI
jgi:hypothetical protein